jgi:chromosome partitioning protein
MVDRRKALHREICDTRGSDYLTTAVPYSSHVERMGLRRAPLASFAPRTPAAAAYTALAEEIESRLA